MMTFTQRHCQVMGVLKLRLYSYHSIYFDLTVNYAYKLLTRQIHNIPIKFYLNVPVSLFIRKGIQ